MSGPLKSTGFWGLGKMVSCAKTAGGTDLTYLYVVRHVLREELSFGHRSDCTCIKTLVTVCFLSRLTPYRVNLTAVPLTNIRKLKLELAFSTASTSTC